MADNEHGENHGERLATLEEWKSSQEKFNQYAIEELKEIKESVQTGLEKISTVATAMEKQKSFLAGISFSFAAVGAGIALIVNNVTLYLSGTHHS